MTFNDFNDDLGNYQRPFTVVACLAVLGRGPLLKHTIRRLYRKNGVYKVVCAGHLEEDKKICAESGAAWVHAENKPLGKKWNAAFQKAKEYNPDACLFVGSSDWLCDDWVTLMKPHLHEHGFVGAPGCYLVDIRQQIRLVNWKGYKGYRVDRQDETIGIGRMLSRRLLDALGWNPFNSLLDNSLDRSMKDRAKSFGFADFMAHDDRLKSLSISTNLWPNKHVFEMHWGTHPHKIPSQRIEDYMTFLTNYFPEALQLHETLCNATSVKA